jgi:hypothetical protein
MNLSLEHEDFLLLPITLHKLTEVCRASHCFSIIGYHSYKENIPNQLIKSLA